MATNSKILFLAIAGLSVHLLMVSGCEHRPEREPSSIEVQGHRGARGLWPENTLDGFVRAAELGVDVLELDCVLSADGQVIVHHDLYFNPDITRQDGQWLKNATQPLREQTLAQIQAVDVGSIRPGTDYAKRFASQQAMAARIPTLTEVLSSTKDRWPNLRYNIELKLDPFDQRGSSKASALAAGVVEVVRKSGLAARVTIQSFVFEALSTTRKIAPQIPCAALTSEGPSHNTVLRGNGNSRWTGRDVRAFGGLVPRMVKDVGCSIWSPSHHDVTSQNLAEARRLGLRTIVWTVNEPDDIERMIALRVDGIISDYPDRVLQRIGRSEAAALAP